MFIDGIVLLHMLAFLVSAVVLTVSLTLFLLLKEQWRLYFSLFISAATVFLLCDTLGILLVNGPAWIHSVLLIAICVAALLIIPLLLKLYQFGIRFVLKRWEKRYLFLFMIPVSYLTTAVFLHFSYGALTLHLIIVFYCSVTGAVIYLLSIKRMKGNPGDLKIEGSERELVFFLLTTVVLLPLELLEYLYKLLKGSSDFFPIRLLVTPLFLLELGFFFTVTGFRTVRRLRPNAEPTDIPFSLTVREKEVALLITEGLTHKEIALKLFISRRTVDRHVENIYRKCGAKNKADFIRSVIIPN